MRLLDTPAHNRYCTVRYAYLHDCYRCEHERVCDGAEYQGCDPHGGHHHRARRARCLVDRHCNVGRVTYVLIVLVAALLIVPARWADRKWPLEHD